MSPLRYVLLAGLAHHWVEFQEHRSLGATVIRRLRADCRKNELESIRLRATAVIDDNIQLANSYYGLSKRSLDQLPRRLVQG